MWISSCSDASRRGSQKRRCGCPEGKRGVRRSRKGDLKCLLVLRLSEELLLFVNQATVATRMASLLLHKLPFVDLDDFLTTAN
jgi:hypothetical protein